MIIRIEKLCYKLVCRPNRRLQLL